MLNAQYAIIDEIKVFSFHIFIWETIYIYRKLKNKRTYKTKENMWDIVKFQHNTNK